MKLTLRTTLIAAMLLTPLPAYADRGPCFGDLDGDGVVGLGDLSILLAAYETCEGDPFYNPVADLDDSACIDLGDLALLLAVYATTCPDVVATELAGDSLSVRCSPACS